MGGESRRMLIAPLQILGGRTAFVAALGPLLAERIMGCPARWQIDVSLLESAMCLTEVGPVAFWNGVQPLPRLGINRFVPTFPGGIFAAREGFVGVTALTPAQWKSQCELVGHPEFADEPGFQTALGRLLAADEIEAWLAPALRKRTGEHWFHAGQARLVPIALVPTLRQVLEGSRGLSSSAVPQLIPPVEAIRVHLASWKTPFPDLAVFATTEPEAIAERVDAFCRQNLGTGVAGYPSCTASQGVTHGVALENGERVVVKAHQPPQLNPQRHSDARALNSVHRALEHLHDQGFPCPRPLLGPRPLARGLATVQELLDTGVRGDGFRPAHRGAIAGGLREGVERLAPMKDELPGLLFFFQPAERLYPTPHSWLFDFGATSRGAEWIDAIARRARRDSVQVGPSVIGHADWRIEHLRFDNDRISASYDWESLAPMPETQLVGLTASAYTTDWSSYAPGRVPTVEAVLAFIADYEAVRGKPFSRVERASILAMCVYATAYGSRCQHALAPATLETEWPEDSWPGLLRASAAAFLSSGP